MIHVFIALGLVLAFELPYLIKTRQYQSLLVFSVIFVITFVFAVLIAKEVRVPSSLIIIGKFFQKIGLSY